MPAAQYVVFEIMIRIYPLKSLHTLYQKQTSIILVKKFDTTSGVNLVGNFLGGDDDRLLSGPNFLLAKLAMLKHLTL